MILKVITDFDNMDIDFLNVFKDYNILMQNKSLYISDVKNSNFTLFKNKIKKIFNNNAYISEINIKNIDREPERIKQWCQGQLNWATLIAIEKENQEVLKETMYILNEAEKEIFSEEIIKMINNNNNNNNNNN